MKHTQGILDSLPTAERKAEAKRRMRVGLAFTLIGVAVLAGDFVLASKDADGLGILHIAVFCVGIGTVFVGGIIAKGELVKAAILDLLGPVGDFLVKIRKGG